MPPPPNGEYPPGPSKPISKKLAAYFPSELIQQGIYMEISDVLRTFRLEKHVLANNYKIYSGVQGVRHIEIHLSNDVITDITSCFVPLK